MDEQLLEQLTPIVEYMRNTAGAGFQLAAASEQADGIGWAVFGALLMLVGGIILHQFLRCSKEADSHHMMLEYRTGGYAICACLFLVGSLVITANLSRIVCPEGALILEMIQ